MQEALRGLEPRVWEHSGGVIHSLTRSHGIRSRFVLGDADPHDLESVVLWLEIGGRRQPLYSTEDLVYLGGLFGDRHEKQLQGDIGERVGRRILKEFLRRHFPPGRVSPTFGLTTPNERRDGYVIRQNGEYRLCVERFPNLGLYWGRQLRQTAESDGVFFYEYKGEQYIFHLEVKTGEVTERTTHRRHVLEMMRGLQSLWPDAQLVSVLFAHEDLILEGDWRGLRQYPVTLYHSLRNRGISPLFLTFTQSQGEFDLVVQHLRREYARLHNRPFMIRGRVEFTPDSTRVYTEGGRHFVTLPPIKH